MGGKGGSKDVLPVVEMTIGARKSRSVKAGTRPPSPAAPIVRRSSTRGSEAKGRA